MIAADFIYRFEWDAIKAKANAAKHGITFEEATTVFNDPLAVTIYDQDHSEVDERWITLGQAESSKYMVVIHTWLQIDPAIANIRIISARAATKSEIRDYEATQR
jgi:hypothetical protein